MLNAYFNAHFCITANSDSRPIPYRMYIVPYRIVCTLCTVPYVYKVNDF